MADERTLPERLIDLAVYVPVGIAVSVIEELPALAEKGRERLGKQLQVARMIGKFTVAEAQRRAGKAAGPPAGAGPRTAPAGDARASNGTAPAASPSPSAPAASARPRSQVAKPAKPARAAKTPEPAEPETSATKTQTAADAPAKVVTPDVASLPIPGYDTLAASQVVQRLGSLRPDELEAVQRYEVATRGRRTILHRIAQLSSSDGRASA